MNLKELKEQVNKICDRIEHNPNNNLEDYTVSIPASHLGCVGGQPCVGVKGVNLGFDWDKSKFFIWPDTLIRATDRDEIAALNKEINKLQHELYALHKNTR